MQITVEPCAVESLYPVTRPLTSIIVGGESVEALLLTRLTPAASAPGICRVRADFRPSAALVLALANATGSIAVRDPLDNALLLEYFHPAASTPTVLAPDAESWRIRFPWDLLRLNEEVVAALAADDIRGTVRERVTIDGHIRLGEGSVILPGVYIEGNAVFGKNCKIGPNCYIRGNTSTGDKCHIGQAVEIKNSLLFDHVSVGHLSYAGDSVICDHVNFGAGTIISNLRHDGRNHRWKTADGFIDTGRRKFGAIVGENVHTGIHSAIYPGRMIPPNAATRPGDVIDK